MIKRYIKPEDYPELCSWWTAWGWAAFSQDCLSPTGIMIEKDGVNLCAVWVYKTDSAVCWIENYISNKAISGAKRNAALDMLVLSAIEESKTMGFRFAMSGIKHNLLARRLENNGFLKSDENVTHYVRVL